MIPTQWIAKQYTELLGRTPTTAEWNAALDHFGSVACDGRGLGSFAEPLALSTELRAAYPDGDPSGRAARITALVRAGFNREVTLLDWQALYEPFDAGVLTWDDVVSIVYGSSELADDASRICDPSAPGYGFDAELAIDVAELVGLGPSRSQSQLQSDIDAQAAGGGGAVSLRPGERVEIGDSGNGNRNLVIRSGVTLTTDGAPGPDRYALMGRLVAHPGALTCTATSCDTVGVVQLEPGAELRNVWVDPKTATEDNYELAAVDSTGSTAGSATVIADARVATPDRGGAAIRAHGYSSTGTACAGEAITRNLVTGYRSVPDLDSLGRPQAADGIEVHCEGTTVTDNDIVDISGDAVMLHGAYNRGADRAVPQHSQVEGNHVLSAGIDASVAYGTDPVGECFGVYNGPLVPCLNFFASRSFAGSLVTGNTMTTGPRTHLDVGLLIGGFPRWDHFSAPGTSATFTGNAIGGRARVKTGIAVAGMANASVAGNDTDYTLVETNPEVTYAECPRVRAVASPADASTLAAPGQGVTVDAAVLGCLVAAPPRELEPIAVQGTGFVGGRSGRPFVPWGFTIHVGIDEALGGDPRLFVEQIRAVKRLGGNVARIPLDVIDVIDPPGPDFPDGTPDPAALHQLAVLADLADQNGVYLEISGLRTTENFNNGDWYDDTDEQQRWTTQRLFWRLVSSELRDADSIAWFSIMSEPVVRLPGSPVWCTGTMSGLCFVQTLTKTPGDRDRIEIYEEWTSAINEAITAGDPVDPHLTSIGALPYGNSGFRPSDLLGLQSFGSVHVYPSGDDLTTPGDEMQRDFDTVASNTAPGQPLVIDETGTLRSTGVELRRFMVTVRPQVSGWVAQYGGPVDFTRDLTVSEQLRLDMYQVFVSLTSRFACGAQSTPPVTKLPSTRITLPTADSTVHGTAAILWASALGGDGRATQVAFSITGGELTDVPVGTATPTQFGWGYGWDTTTVPDGTYSVASTVTNSLGLQARSEPVTFVVDNTLPEAAPITAPVVGQRVAGTNVALRATGDVLDVATLEFRLSGTGVDDQVIATGTPDGSGWTARWDATAVPDGAYTLTTVAFDAAGNSRRSAPVTIRVARSPIETAVTAPVVQAVLRGTADLAATTDGTVARLEFRATGGNVMDRVVSAGTASASGWSGRWVTSTVPSGSYSLVSVAYAADGTAYRSPPVQVFVDNALPTTAVSVPKANAAVGTSVALKASASDNLGISQVQFRVSGGGLADAVVAGGTLSGTAWTATWSTAGLPAGAYSLSSVAFDRAGNTRRSTAVPITVDNVAPTSVMVSPPSGATIKATRALLARATDNVGITKVEFRATGGAVTNKLVGTGVLSGSGYTAAWDTTTVGSGAYSVVSVASDAVGNKTTSAPFTLTVDNIAPVTAVVSPTAGAIVKGTAANLRATVSDNIGTAKVEFRLTGGSISNQLIANGVRGTTGWTATWNSTTVPVGPYTLVSVAYDRAGTATTSAPISIVVQRAAAATARLHQ